MSDLVVIKNNVDEENINGRLSLYCIIKKVETCINVYLLFLLFTLLSCGGVKDPLKAPELKGAELEDFLDSPIKYGPTFRNNHVKDIFYSGGLIDGMKILPPKKLGMKNDVKHYSIIIEPVNNSGNSTILFFEGRRMSRGSDVFEFTFTKLQQGENTRYQYKMNPFLLNLYPIGYFEQVAEDIVEYDEGEPQRTAERKERLEKDMYAVTHPFDYIKKSNFILRAGIDDVRATIGDTFYIDNLPGEITIEEPYQSGKQYVIPITIKAPTDVVKTSIYLDYDEKNKISLVDKIVMAGNKETQTAKTFEEKYQVILMLLSAIRGN